MLAEGIGSVTSQFKKGGMINKNRKKKKLSSKQIDFIETYAKGGQSEGGKTMSDIWNDYKIADQYEGKKPEDIWFRLSPSQRKHLLSDHANINSGDLSSYIGDDTKFDELPHFVKQIVKKHFSEGQYAKGGEVDNKYYASIITHNQNVEPYSSVEPQTIITKTKEEMVEKLNELYKKTFFHNYSPYEISDFDEKNAIKGTYISDDWAYVTKDVERFKEIHKIHLKDFFDLLKKNGQARIRNNKYSKGGEVDMLTEDDYVWNAVGKKLVVNKVTKDEYYLSGFGQPSASPFSKNKVHSYLKKGEWSLKAPKFAKGGTTDPKPSAQDILKRLGYDIPKTEENVEDDEPKIIRGWVDDEPYYYSKGGMSKDDSPKVYIADLSEYNNGRLVGKWFDLTDYSNGAELMADIQEMLDEQTKKDKYGDVHEEYAVHDYENFPREFYSEYMGEADFDKLIKLINDSEDAGLPFDVISQAMADLGKDEVSDVVEAYFGSVPASMGNEWRDFAYEYIDSLGSIADAVSNPEYYFDFDNFGREARWDFTEEEEKEMGYENMSDEELGEQLVEEMGGVENLGEMTLQNYFDYDKLGRDLQYDFTAIRGEDGDYYFFNSNYKKGGSLRSKPEPEDDGEYVLSDEEKQIIRGYVDDEPYYFADGGEVTADERKKSLKGYPKLKF
jgi:antirestriction protein